MPSEQRPSHAPQQENHCIFCAIAASKAEASKVYEDDHTVAFMNLRQANQGHVLVIPKRHYRTIHELDDETAAHLLQTVVKIARAIQQSIDPEGITIWQSNGQAAGQEIDHVHVHILPRYMHDQAVHFYPNPPSASSREELERIAATIRAAII